MQHGQKLHEYRVFCDDCTASLDVKAIDAGDDTNREARKKGWSAGLDGVLCPLCFQYEVAKRKERNPTPKDEYL